MVRAEASSQQSRDRVQEQSLGSALQRGAALADSMTDPKGTPNQHSPAEPLLNAGALESAVAAAPCDAECIDISDVTHLSAARREATIGQQVLHLTGLSSVFSV